jgi:starch synthase
VYFLDHQGLYGRNGIYGPNASSEFPDNLRRFTLLSRGAFQLCKKLDWIPDVVHAHDWPAALAPVYLYTWEKGPPFTETAGVLTVHNLGYQGVFPKNDIHVIQLPWEHFHNSGFEFFDKLNLLQAGIRNADIITTVSPAYAREIQTPEYGFLLDGVLRHRAGDLFGVLNGIDYDAWNPETDPHITHNFSEKSLKNKLKVKKMLQEECGLPVNEKIPLVGMVTRLVEQKGMGALAGPAHGSLYKICTELSLQMVILGTGEEWCERELKELEFKLPNLKVFLRFDDRHAHLIEAGSDFFLMPSRYEPCGLNQLYSLRYGTLPIVRNTGGLSDTVENYDQSTGAGTGFMFNELTPGSIFDTVGWAVWAYYNKPEHILGMRKRAMKKRYTWDRSARKYSEIYQWAADRRTGRFPRAW